MIDVETLRSVLRCEPETGKLYWMPRPSELFPDKRSANVWNARYAGREAFTAACGDGYRRGTVFYTNLKAHRVIWALVHGEWPADQIDHINGDPSDNRICNLRSVSNAENSRNSARPINNTSGVRGVYWHQSKNKWRARIGKNISLGYFADFDEAVAARKAAEAERGYHPNHGRAA
jgi:hypothetical protein